jgi:hypothetical protein
MPRAALSFPHLFLISWLLCAAFWRVWLDRSISDDEGDRPGMLDRRRLSPEQLKLAGAMFFGLCCALPMAIALKGLGLILHLP